MHCELLRKANQPPLPAAPSALPPGRFEHVKV